MIKKITLAFILLFFILNVRASHIVGGEFTYRWIGGNNFELTLTVYRDSFAGVPFDPTIVIGIFDKATNVRTDTLEIPLNSSGPMILSGPAASCATPPNVSVLQGQYVDTISLPNNSHGYYISWERCCRNAAVNNIASPNMTGIVSYLEMPDPALHNSSPVFLSDPLPFICENQPLNYSFAASDPNGDVLVYELADPLAGNTGYPVNNNPVAILPTPLPGPYAAIAWAQGFSLSNVCGSSTNPLAVNPSTGNLTVTVDFSGIFAAAVIVHEFRNGVEIGLVRREIEFSVIICPNAPATISLSPNASSSTVTINNNSSVTAYETDTICLTVSSHDPTDSVFLSVSGEVFPGGGINPPYATANNDSGALAAYSYFCWKTACGQGRTAPYKVVYKAKDNGCPLPSTTTDTIKVTLKPVPVYNSLNLLCIGLKDNTSAEVFWTNTNPILSKFFHHYEIYRSVNGSPFTLLGIVTNPSEESFIDNTAIDYLQNDYCYYIIGINSCEVAGISSDTLCTISQANTKINYIKQVSVIDSGKIEMTWKHFPDGPYCTFNIYRKENVPGSGYELYKTLTHPDYDSWTDDVVSTSEKSYCYYLVNVDYCGNISPISNEACSILLSGKDGPSENILDWTPYITWAGGVDQYEIYRKSLENNSYSGLPVFSDNNYSYRDFDLGFNSGRFTYYVRAMENSGNAESISNEITLNQQPSGFLPAGFTPNGDGINDTWGLSSSFIKNFDLKVFNRWGTLIFQTNNKKVSWNGTFKDKSVTQGSYVYTIRYTGFESADEKVKTGTVTIIR